MQIFFCLRSSAALESATLHVAPVAIHAAHFNTVFVFNTSDFFCSLCCPFAASVVVASSTTSDLQRPENTHFVWSVGNANSCCCIAWCCCCCLCALATVCCCGAVCCGCGYCCRLSIGQLQVAACVSAYEISQQLLSELHSYR